MKRILIYALLFAILPTWAMAQEKSSIIDSIRTQLDSVIAKKHIPLTRQQAAILVSKLVAAATQKEYLAARQDSLVMAFKMEALKRKLLDNALRKAYTQETDERIQRLENLVFLSLLKEGKITPQELQVLLGYSNGGGNPMVYAQPFAQPMPTLPLQNPTSATTYKRNAQQPSLAKGLTAAYGEESNAIQQDLLKTTKLQGNNLTDEKNHITPVKTDFITIAHGQRVDTIYREKAGVEPFLDQVFFEFNSSRLTPIAHKKLNEMVEKMQENPSLVILLKGYASPEGNMQYNNKLSSLRVKACYDYLLKKGVPAQRMSYQTAGIDSVSKRATGARRVDIFPDFWKMLH